MNQIVDMKHETETLTEMKHRYEDEKRIIIIARKDLNAITTLLDKMKQLPIISGISTDKELVAMASSNIQDGQLAKLMKGIQNYYILAEDLTRQINIQDKQLEEKRERNFLKQSLIDLYNKIHSEGESLTKQRDIEKTRLKKKEEEIILLANNVKLSTLDIDFIENRLEARSNLFENYIKSNQTSDDAIKKITTELGNHIEDIRKLSNDFINSNTNPEQVHELLNKIKEKENIMDMAADLLKKYDQENTNLQQLFDAIRLNNMTNIFEMLIQNFQKMVHDMAECKEEIENARSRVTEIENLVKTKNEHLEILLEEIMTNMKTKPIAYPTNDNNKDLLDYFTNVYNLKKENQTLKTLAEKIKSKGTEVVYMCRDIINYQERENEKLSLEISAKTDVVNKLQEKFCALRQEVHANTEIINLQSKLVILMEENEHLLLMNAYFKSVDAKLSSNVKNAEVTIAFLENENARLYESNAELKHSNNDLKKKVEKMEKYVEFVQTNLMQLEFDEDEVYNSHDSDDSYNVF